MVFCVHSEWISFCLASPWMEPGKLGPTRGGAAVATCRPSFRVGAWHWICHIMALNETYFLPALYRVIIFDWLADLPIIIGLVKIEIWLYRYNTTSNWFVSEFCVDQTYIPHQHKLLILYWYFLLSRITPN